MQVNRFLIVNADDFGLSEGVNAGVIEAHRAGIVTSASLMVRQPGVHHAVCIARECPDLSMGLHLDLGEWIYLNGDWVVNYAVVDLDDESSVRAEVQRQLELFRSLVGREPSHVDSHQHIHHQPEWRTLIQDLVKPLGVPLRHVTAGIRYCGQFYGQTGKGETIEEFIGTESLLAILDGLPTGITELACHPGWDDALQTMYCAERRREVSTLCDPRVRERIDRNGVELVSFAELSSIMSNRNAVPARTSAT